MTMTNELFGALDFEGYAEDELEWKERRDFQNTFAPSPWRCVCVCVCVCVHACASVSVCLLGNVIYMPWYVFWGVYIYGLWGVVYTWSVKGGCICRSQRTILFEIRVSCSLMDICARIADHELPGICSPSPSSLQGVLKSRVLSWLHLALTWV
jgi:hypothetical protein